MTLNIGDKAVEYSLKNANEEIGGQLYQVTKRQKPTVTDERLGKKGKVVGKK